MTKRPSEVSKAKLNQSCSVLTEARNFCPRQAPSQHRFARQKAAESVWLPKVTLNQRSKFILFARPETSFTPVLQASSALEAFRAPAKTAEAPTCAKELPSAQTASRASTPPTEHLAPPARQTPNPTPKELPAMLVSQDSTLKTRVVKSASMALSARKGKKNHVEKDYSQTR